MAKPAFDYFNIRREMLTEEDISNRIKRAAVASDLNVTLETVGEWVGIMDIRISDKVRFNLTIAVPVGSYQMTSSVYTSEVMSICSMSVVSVGSNFVGIQASDFLPSYNQNTQNGTQQFYNNLDVSIDFGTIQNDGSNPTSTDNDIVVQFDVIVVNSSMFANGFIYTVSANVTLDSYTESASMLFTGFEQILFSIVPPIANVSSPGPVDVGDIANWTVTLDLRDAVNKIHVHAWVNGTFEYPVCNMFLGQTGPAFACFEKESGILSSFHGSLAYEIPTIINTEFNTNVSAPNSTMLEILVLTRVPHYVTMTDSLFLNIEVFLDDKLVFPMSEPIVTTTNTLPSPGAVPQILISTIENVNTVAIGSAIVFIIDVTTPPGTVTIYDVIITTDSGVVTICDVQLMGIGDNLCMDRVVNTTFTSSTNDNFYDGANVPIGSVPNLNGSADPSAVDNNFRLEAVLCVPDFSSATVGDALTLTADVYYDPTKPNTKVSDTFTYTIAASPDPLLASGNVSFSNGSVVPGYISQTVEVNVTAVFEQTADSFLLYVSVPVIGGSSLAFLEYATLSRIGTDLPCVENRTLALLSNETVSFTQTVLLVYDLGPVSHTGQAERNPFVPSNSSGENVLEFTVTLLIADHVENIQGALLPVNVTLEGASGTSAVGTAYVEVQISAVEAPQLVFIFTMEQFNYTEKKSGDNLTCDAILYLNENSTAHAQDVIVHVMTPYYIGFGSLYDVQDANVTHISNLPEPGMSFSVSEIDFKDNVSFTFSLILDPARDLPMGLENFETVVVVDMTTRGPLRPDRTDTGIMYTELNVFEFGFNTEMPNAIGMEGGVIQDCQITASSFLDTNSAADVRLNAGIGWKPLVRGTPFCEEYVKIDIGTPAYVTGVQVQSTTDSYQDIVTAFTLHYSDDGIVWYHVTQEDGIATKTFYVNVTTGGSVGDIYNVALTENERFTARYVRLTSGSCLVGLRLELTGLKQSGPTVDCATIQEKERGIPEQSYIVDGITGKIFVCGLQGVDQDVTCSWSDDNGESWIEIDDNIGTIVALVSNKSLVIGKANDNVTLLVSEDEGLTWDTLTDAFYTELQAMTGYTLSKDFPYEDNRGQSYNNMYTSHGMDGPNSMSLTGTMSGIAVSEGGPWADVAWWGTEDWNLL